MLLCGIPWELTDPLKEGIEVEVREEGRSFEENALLKARAYAEASGSAALADDSGLEVDALGGEPGVLSARYAGRHGDDGANIALLLHKLSGVPWERRKARFRCVIAIAGPLGYIELCEGICEGFIAFEPRGSGGFGYDPVFFVPEFGKTMAELPLEVKNKISHRAKAAFRAREILQDPEKIRLLLGGR